jgi:hypothetical protein
LSTNWKRHRVTNMFSKTNCRGKRLFIAIGLLVAVFAVVLQCLIAWPVRSKGAETANLISQIELGVRTIERDRSRSIETLCATTPSTNTNLNARLARVLTEVGGISFKTDSRGLLCDAWGRPLNVVYRNEISTTNLGGSLVATTNSLFIWSCGPNGLNENGAGDDITSP